MLKNKNIMKLCGFLLLMVQVLVFSKPAMAWTYRIQEGDSLFKLSQRYGTEVTTLCEDNQLPSDQIITDHQLWIPDSKPMPSSRGDEELYLLARLISGEARGESYQGQVAVGAVIMNRIQASGFPKTIAGNVFKSGEFESVSNGQIWETVTASSLEAARAALSGWDPTGGALYFYNPGKVLSKTSWIWTRQVTGQIGQHVFAV